MYTAEEMMAVAGARQLVDGQVCFVGIGLPGRAAILAKRTHAPGCVLVYESGILGADPATAPLSIGDGILVETADVVVPMGEMFNYWLQGGWIDVGFLGAAQIDRFGNINTTVVGDYEHPSVRLPGAGGAPEIASSAGEVIVIVRHQPRALVETVDFITSVGHLDGGEARLRLGLRGRGPTRIVTDLGVLTLDDQSGSFKMAALHPGTERNIARERTGWQLEFADEVEELFPPTAAELAALRALG